MKRIFIIALVSVSVMLSCGRSTDERAAPDRTSSEEFARPAEGIEKRIYMCRRTGGRPVIDGRINEEEWFGTVWTEDFLDITGVGEHPTLRTQARMLWDEDYLYIGARMEEPDVQATLELHDEIIWKDNDFEIFIDPDGDTHEYYEIEVNAMAAVFDLLLVKPYRDGGPALHHWDIPGLKTAVLIDGTLNDPADRDVGWEVELAIPWDVLSECANKAAPPSESDVWRMNFSRVEWKTVVEGGRYVKATDPETGRPYREKNWCWSPQGIENMHYPEMWGYVQFTSADPVHGGRPFIPGPDEEAWQALREIYYAEKTHYIRHGEYTGDLGALGLVKREIFGHIWPPAVEATTNRFEARLETLDGSGTKQITEDGRTRVLD